MTTNQVIRKLAVVTAIAALAACATTSEGGWTGQGAEPFGAAQAACRQQSEGQDAAAFEACMASKGWRRLGG